jgi:hypothetical protein
MMTAKMGERDSREEILKAFRLFDDVSFSAVASVWAGTACRIHRRILTHRGNTYTAAPHCSLRHVPTTRNTKAPFKAYCFYQ